MAVCCMFVHVYVMEQSEAFGGVACGRKSRWQGQQDHGAQGELDWDFNPGTLLLTVFPSWLLLHKCAPIQTHVLTNTFLAAFSVPSHVDAAEVQCIPDMQTRIMSLFFS